MFGRFEGSDGRREACSWRTLPMFTTAWHVVFLSHGPEGPFGAKFGPSLVLEKGLVAMRVEIKYFLFEAQVGSGDTIEAAARDQQGHIGKMSGATEMWADRRGHRSSSH